MMGLLNQIGSLDLIPTAEQILEAGRVLRAVGAVLVAIGSLITVVL
jgi:hypothetical protein